MKTRKLAFTIIVVMLGVSTVFAQGRRNANRPGAYSQRTSMNILLDLTEEQQAEMDEQVAAHQKDMAEMRVKMRSTYDPIEKNEIRGEMLKKVRDHRISVRNLLTEDQQKKYDILQRQGFNRGRNMAVGQKGMRGRGNFNGCRRGCRYYGS
ncbi:hypothetical protein SAMN05444274_10676 [Mariniphaga anaerophila]|uniref:Periplasmic heavy metal sensor n=1 Tax=Mariniphaga anaerophila TaxID=1484053 RepID=A0A1M5CDQ7_9BACT|nr:hypothetical protein [Mariniphaga anaerophila]SHF52878.1 hypothetical protein SAMN05444274_10676 [Mariniphaga anaerophila]